MLYYYKVMFRISLHISSPTAESVMLPCPVKSRPTSGDSHDRLPPGVPISS